MFSNYKLKTHPLILHAPGGVDRTMRNWNYARRGWANQKNVGTYRVPENLAIITWNNSKATNDKSYHLLGKASVVAACSKTLGMFEASCRRLGFYCTVLGEDETHWTNRKKIDLTLKFLNTNTKPYVLGCDSSDVLLLGDPGEVLERFLQYKCDALYNAEVAFFPDEAGGKIRKFEESVGKKPFCYLNAGVWIAKHEACKKIHEMCLKLPHEASTLYPWSEQLSVHHVYHHFYPQMQIDWRCKVFQTIDKIPPTWFGFSR